MSRDGMIDANQRRTDIKEYIQKLGTLDPNIIGTKKLSEKYKVSGKTIRRDIVGIEKELDIHEKKVGIIARENITDGGKDMEKIWIAYDDNGKTKKVVVKYFPNHQIATIKTATKNGTDETDEIKDKIVEKGMEREEIANSFPPTHDYECNVLEVIRSIIYEAYRKEGLTGKIEGGNVRHFWYTHLKHLLMKVLGINDDGGKLGSLINQAWRAVIKSGIATYEDMKIRGGKEKSRMSVIRDSPCSNIIIAVEKDDFFDAFCWIPKLFNCTLIAGGGEPSRAVSRRFVLDLKENNVDLNQQFHMCVASDLDPAGYNIQKTFRDQLEAAIKHYGGSGSIEIHRLFVRKDQVSSTLLENQAIPWQPNAEKESAKKQADTLWKHFCEKTDGGLYIPVPDGWTGNIDEVDGQPMVRALLEMDAFSTEVIEQSIVKELLQIIRETSDETKIMIPEIMRVFEEIRDGVIGDVYERWQRKLVEPLKREFLRDTDEWKDSIDEENERGESEVEEEYDNLIAEKEKEKEERAPDLFDEKYELKQQHDFLEAEMEEEMRKIREEYEEPIEKIETKRDAIKEKIGEECSDLDEEIADLDDERESKLESVEEEYNFRMDEYRKFKEDRVAVFNPVEKALLADIKKRMSQSNMPYSFKDLENREETRMSISGLLVNPNLLLEKNISCFDHPAPTFHGKKWLEEASNSKNLNIGDVRDSFPSDFLDGLKEIVETDSQDLTFELSKSVEMKDLSEEVKKAMTETEMELGDV